MSRETAKLWQRVLWHIRWVLLAGIMSYDVYSVFVSFHSAPFLQIHGMAFAFYFFLGQWEDYFNCKGSCEL
ncbi:MAG: hypothetical protein Q8935_04090 [Bacillota bacterium]|jgi:hypothetical protein|nr:hypothetical protein [Bacillota bacterium]MDP4154142.1 hypothetical protein [Bacillota bacterium]